jgi:hypothetical protein
MNNHREHREDAKIAEDIDNCFLVSESSVDSL